jgi:L-ascorbate metabolism protein UlaG (beta-lactamase superfamily)
MPRRLLRPLPLLLATAAASLACGRPDLSAHAELWAPAEDPGAAPAGERVVVSFLGVTTLLVTDGETSLLTDGFFSRPGALRVALGEIAPDAERIAAALERAGVRELAAVAPVHSHYDHAMDAPEVARRTGALLLGSESTANLGRGAGLAEDRLRVVEPGRRYVFGRFGLTFLESRHVDFGANRGTLGGSIDAPLVPPARASAWAEGSTWSILIDHPQGALLVQGSAGFVPGALAGRSADVVFLGVGGLGRAGAEHRDAYLREVVEAVSPSLVVPVHWDDFTRPLDRPLLPFPRFVDDLDLVLAALRAHAAARGYALALFPAFQPVAVLPR